METVKFKEKDCSACRAAIRKEIISEIHEDAGCNKCKRLNETTGPRESHQILQRVHGKLKAKGRRKV